LVELLDSKQPNLQHNAAFALYGLADNEDNIPAIIREGGLQQLIECNEKLQVQASKVGSLRALHALTCRARQVAQGAATQAHLARLHGICSTVTRGCVQHLNCVPCASCVLVTVESRASMRREQLQNCFW
jgi:hypothetical protein